MEKKWFLQLKFFMAWKLRRKVEISKWMREKKEQEKCVSVVKN